MKLLGLSFVLTITLSAVGGCSHARYSGAEPSVRAFNENAGIKDTYVGLDFGFTLEQDEPHVPSYQRSYER